MRSLGHLASVVGLFAAVVNASLNPIVVKGNAFFDSVTGKRFYIRGVDYQPGGSSAVNYDPLADVANCKLNIPYMQQLGLNAVRIYSVDNSADHRECMALLDAAGIYLILDVNTPTNSLNRADPANSYNAIYLQHVFSTIDAFKIFSNTLGFFSGNEVINDVNTTGASTWVKATTRDMKAYIAKQSSRTIPVGYSAADVSENRLPLAEYLNCGSDSERVNFYAFNSYSWCGNASYTTSGYDQRVADFANYSVPLFFSEYGCNLVQPRLFTEVGALYSSQMTPVFSGGLVYEWSQETSHYGLVELSNGNITLLQDYQNLKAEFASTSMPSGDGGYKASGSASTCPVNGTDFTSWAVLPALPEGAQNYIDKGAGKALGYSGPSNQGAGGAATAPVPAGTSTNTATSCASCSVAASGSSTSKSSGHILLATEGGVAGGALLAAVAAIVGAMVII